MHELLVKQLEQTRATTGEVDLDALAALVSAAYREWERERDRTESSVSQMKGELDQLKQELEQKVEKRTAELCQSRTELELQNTRFQAALANMPHGLSMFDSDGRLIICNERYLEMYELPPEFGKPGSQVLELLNYRYANGTLEEDPELFLAELLQMVGEGHATQRVREFSDGRCVGISVQPVPGGGWVTIHEDITERRSVQKRIEHMARHDALTNLPNRVLLRERLEAALDRDEPLAVHYLDIDRFKTINDTLGHHIGDMLLMEVAARLCDHASDTGTVARIGGDEFAIIQCDIDGPMDAATLAKDICDTINGSYDLEGHVVIADVSVGIAFAQTDGSDANELLKNADLALHRAKADGKGMYRFFEPDMDARMKARRELELELRSAFEQETFELHYQPIVSLSSGDVVSFEALLRWPHPERGMIAPSEFIPVAEEIGLIASLGDWVLRTACRDAGEWPPDVRVAINLSPSQLIDENMVSRIVEALRSSRLPACRLEIEITEEVLIRNPEVARRTLHQLREVGVRIALDDFGTGYSSLSYLRKFPFDKIKIDRSFVSDLPSPEPAAIVSAITGLARTLDLTTTAEGIETPAQLRQARALGCTEIQGFLVSPARRPDDIARFFKREAERDRGAA